MAETGKRGQVDWAALERDYRAGTFSNRELAHRYGCAESAIRYRAKAHEWQKDLNAEVRKATSAKLLRAELRTPNAQEDAEIVDQASDFRASVVTTHRRDIQQLNGLKRILGDRLGQVLNGATPDGPCLGERESPGDLLEKMTRITSKLIPLERQAYSLDSQDGDDDGSVKVVGGLPD